MKGLEIEPELRTGIQCLGEKPRSLWSHTALSPNDLVDPLHGHTDVLGKGYLSDFQGFEKLSLEYFSWMCWNSVLWYH
jgi:hypothetical protein